MPTIAALPAVTAPALTDTLPVSQNGVTRAETIQQILTLIEPVVTAAVESALGVLSVTPGTDVSGAAVTAAFTGAMPMILSKRASRVIDAEEFGAVPDGNTDCAPALNLAYTAAMATNAAAIRIPRGLLKLASPLVFTPGADFRLYGYGRKSSVLMPTHNGVGLSVSPTNQSYLVEMCDLGFLAACTSGPTACALRILQGTSDTAYGRNLLIEHVGFDPDTTSPAAPYAGTFTGGLDLAGGHNQGVVRVIDYQNPTPALAGTYAVRYRQAFNLHLDDLDALNGEVGFWQVGYSEGVEMKGSHLLSCDVGYRNDSVPSGEQVNGNNAGAMKIVGGEWDCLTAAVVAQGVSQFLITGGSFSASNAGATVLSVTGGNTPVIVGSQIEGTGSGIGMLVTGTDQGCVTGNRFANLGVGLTLGAGTTGINVMGNQGDVSDGVAVPWVDNSGLTTNNIFWQIDGKKILTNLSAFVFSTPGASQGSNFLLSSDGNQGLQLTGDGLGVVLGVTGETAKIYYRKQYLQSFAYADLVAGTNGAPTAANSGQCSVWCKDACVGGQASGSGTGAEVMASGGTWYMMSGAPILT